MTSGRARSTPAPFTPAPPGHQVVALMVTRRCNMTCGHCSVASGPGVGGDPAESELIDWVRQVAAAGVKSIRITGGEPMLRAATVRALARECDALGVFSAVTTNGFWGYSLPKARRELRALKKAGLGSMTVSYDQYHADFQGPQPALHIAQAAEELGFPVTFNVVRGGSEREVADVAAQLAPAKNARLRVYDLQLVGRASELPAGTVRDDAEGFCTSCSYPAIAENGRFITCTGPSYFERDGSPLVVGSLRQSSLADLLDRYRRDPILNVIRTRGPAGLRRELEQIPGFESFPWRARYFGICDLCHHITRDAAAVGALRARLSQPAAVAEQEAAWQVIAGHRHLGELSASYVNGVGSARLFLHEALQPGAGLGPDSARLLGHAHLDWRRLADYLAGSGLARPLLPALDRPELGRWAPAFFRDGLLRRGLRDGLREAIQREAIAQIGGTLADIGARGVLLKGAALLMQAPEGTLARATTDIDILTEPEVAGRLRALLLQRGFEGNPDAGYSTAQHLAPVTFQGVPVEIHTRIMKGYWGLPERAMLDTARPLGSGGPLWTLGPEAQVLHALVHLSASFLSFGAKAGWDLATVLRATPGFDWAQVTALAGELGVPRAFWVPLAAMAEGFELPVPSDVLRRAPRDAGARNLSVVASRRIFRSAEGLFDLDALTKLGMMLLVQDRWVGRAHYLAAQVGWRVSRPSSWGDAHARARRADVLRQAVRQYRRYRRAVASRPFVDVPE